MPDKYVLSAKMTHKIAQRTSLGQRHEKHVLAEGERHCMFLLDAFSVQRIALIVPSDIHWAILLVAVGDEIIWLRSENTWATTRSLPLAVLYRAHYIYT